MHYVNKKGTTRFLYAGPYKTFEKAKAMAYECLSECEISWCDDPEVERHYGYYYVVINNMA